MAKYIVTGGAGFIGSHLVKRLIGIGHEVVVIDNFTTGANEVDGAEYIKVDLTVDDFRGQYTNIKADGMLHLAAQPSGARSFQSSSYDREINLVATRKLLEVCYTNDIPRFIFASTMGVYGDVQSLARETVHCRPKTFYGVHKLAAEGYVNLYSEKLNTTNLRLFTVYGPKQDLTNRHQGHISIYSSFIVANEPILVKGSKDRWRDFIYIDDVVDAWVKAIDEPKTYGETYNLGTGRRTFVFEVIRLLKEYFGVAPDYPLIWSDEKTEGDIFGICADIDKIRRDLEWSPQVSLEEGLQRTVESYRAGL